MKTAIGWIAGASALALVSYAAYSQQAPVPVQPQAPEIVLRMTQQELDIVSEGLQTQPFGKVAPMINKFRQQIIDQQPKPADTEPKKD